MENPIINQLQNRTSIREFTGEKVKDEDLDLILRTAQRAPTSINAQQISLIYTKDKERIKAIAEICGGQSQVATADVFVAVVIDFNRTNHSAIATKKTQVIERCAEGIMVGAVDAGIMLSSLQTAAESLGYGTTSIGAIRENADQVKELLNLPSKTFVAVGSTIGVPSKKAKSAPLKPRVPFESFAMEDVYDSQKVEDGAYVYEKEFKECRDKTGSGFLPTYFETTIGFYERNYYANVAQHLEDQGFKFSDIV